MDLHPIIVHAPIAFLAVYAGLEMLTFVPKLKNSTTFFSIKYFLLTVGFLSAIAATISGENAEHLNGEFLNTNILHLHATYAEATRNLFGILFLIYICIGLTMYPACKAYTARFSLGLANLMQKVGDFFTKYYTLTILLAIVGLGLVSISGALGGALVYGADAKDPFIGFVVDNLCGADCR